MNRGRHKKKPTKYPNTWLTKVMTEAQLDLLFLRAEQQRHSINLRMIEDNPTSIRIIIWDDTPEGWKFWNNLLTPVNEYKNKHKYEL